MIEGAHSIIYSSDPDADRAFFRDVLALPNVDVGGGWLIFGLPPAEVAFHPAQSSGKHELYLMVRDIEQLSTRCGSDAFPTRRFTTNDGAASSTSHFQEVGDWACTSDATIVRLLCQPPDTQLQPTLLVRRSCAPCPLGAASVAWQAICGMASNLRPNVALNRTHVHRPSFGELATRRYLNR